MTAEQIAAEVSKRYGVPVDPAVVKFIPEGVSSFPIYGPAESWKVIRQRQYEIAKKRKKV